MCLVESLIAAIDAGLTEDTADDLAADKDVSERIEQFAGNICN